MSSHLPQEIHHESQTGRGPAVAKPSVLDQLRSGERPRVDPALGGGLREWLEDSLAEHVAELPASVSSVRVNKQSLSQVLLCEAHYLAQKGAIGVQSVEMLLGTLVDALFRVHITAGSGAYAANPLEAALLVLEAEGDRDDVVGALKELGGDGTRRLSEQLRAHMEHVGADWSPLPSSWLPRTQEKVEIPLAGGRVLLTGVFDLLLGAPAAERASECILELKSGRRRLDHRLDLQFYALIETLRSGAPPFRVATYYSSTGELDTEDIFEEMLLASLRRTLDGTIRLCRLVSGEEARRTPNPLCAWCAGLDECGPGTERVASGADSPEEADRGSAAEMAAEMVQVADVDMEEDQP